MESVELHFKDHHAIVELNRPDANAINLLMVQELREAFASLAHADYIRGVVLTGRGTTFSAGLDIVELYGYDEALLDRFWEEFGHLMKELAGFPKPLIAAINGHSPAAGCVLALCCDYRIMAEGDFRIGLNELATGIVVPRPIVELAAFTLGHAKATRMILNAMLLTPKEAQDFGLADHLCSQSDVVSRAEFKLSTWFAFSDTAWRNAKKKLRRPLLEALDMEVSEAFGDTIRAWWSFENRAEVGKLVEQLTKKG